jgi:hypothetical protein
MTRLGGVKNSGGGGNAPGWVGERRGAVSLKDLPEEEQRVFEIYDALKKSNEPVWLGKFLKSIESSKHGTKAANDPPSAGDLKAIAAHYESIGISLSSAGVARFKAERSLVGGTITGAIAKAFVRALEGGEILVLVSKSEESALRPSEKACLTFLRELSKKSGADVLRPIKQRLGLNNPALSDEAEELENEYVGATTVKEIATATTLRRVPLTKEGMRDLALVLEREAQDAHAAKKSTGPKK